MALHGHKVTVSDDVILSIYGFYSYTLSKRFLNTFTTSNANDFFLFQNTQNVSVKFEVKEYGRNEFYYVPDNSLKSFSQFSNNEQAMLSRKKRKELSENYGKLFWN